jgi:hypothetical protein
MDAVTKMVADYVTKSVESTVGELHGTADTVTSAVVRTLRSMVDSGIIGPRFKVEVLGAGPDEVLVAEIMEEPVVPVVRMTVETVHDLKYLRLEVALDGPSPGDVQTSWTVDV